MSILEKVNKEDSANLYELVDSVKMFLSIPKKEVNKKESLIIYELVNKLSLDASKDIKGF